MLLRDPSDIPFALFVADYMSTDKGYCDLTTPSKKRWRYIGSRDDNKFDWSAAFIRISEYTDHKDYSYLRAMRRELYYEFSNLIPHNEASPA